jgi:hypothetical protein
LSLSLTPPCIPILIELGDYATECVDPLTRSNSSLSDYLMQKFAQSSLPALSPWIQKCLQAGHCLVLLDGLDEVSDLRVRRQVQEAIKSFVLDHPGTSKTHFNRFLITSRIAGYDQSAFPSYKHYTIAELTTEQIESFLPRWCLAIVHRERRTVLSRRDNPEAERMANQLKTTIKEHRSMSELAENPLLLTMLLVIQRNRIELPKQRVELYDVVTQMLLEKRDDAKGLPASSVAQFSIAQAIRRLAPIAFRMQKTGQIFVRQRVVMGSLRRVLVLEGVPSDKIVDEAEFFLKHIRERGGLFVQRTSDYFGFFHRSFQEYFAARHVLNLIKQNPGQINNLVTRARRHDDLWREPFLLAVASVIDEDETTARQIIHSLLTTTQGTDFTSHVHDVLLAAECLIESKPLTLGPVLEKQIVLQLLQVYEEAQRRRLEAVCEQVEDVMRRWLLSLPGEAYRPTVLAVLHDALSGAQQMALQHAALTLLTVITPQLTSCPALVFSSLTPSLLALAGLPAVGDYLPTQRLSSALDLTIATQAVFVLSFMGKQGPGGALLKIVDEYIGIHPEHLRFLARASFESPLLLTPTVVPRSEENRQRYISALKQWIALREQHRTGRVTEREVDHCLTVQRALLDCAEEVAYPRMIYLVNLLQIGGCHSYHSWRYTWQAHISDQITSGSYLNYQEGVLLWTFLFSESHDIETLVALIAVHVSSADMLVQHLARHFLAMLSYYQRALQDMPDLEDQSAVVDQLDRLAQLALLEEVAGLERPSTRALLDQRELPKLRTQLSKRVPPRVQQLRQVISVQYLRDRRALRLLLNGLVRRELRELRDRGNLSKLARLLLTREVAENAVQSLSHAASPTTSVESIDLLLILLGRILQIRKADEKGGAIEQELRQLIQTACSDLAYYSPEESAVRLDLVRSLPIRSSNEITLIMQVAEETTDERIRLACAHALRYATPQTSEAWKMLESVAQSSAAVVGEAAAERLKERR